MIDAIQEKIIQILLEDRRLTAGGTADVGAYVQDDDIPMRGAGYQLNLPMLIGDPYISDGSDSTYYQVTKVSDGITFAAPPSEITAIMYTGCHANHTVTVRYTGLSNINIIIETSVDLVTWATVHTSSVSSAGYAIQNVAVGSITTQWVRVSIRDTDVTEGVSDIRLLNIAVSGGIIILGDTPAQYITQGRTREMTGEIYGLNSVRPIPTAPKHNFLNLFDRPYSKDGDAARPAIYMGGAQTEFADEEDFPVIANGLVEYRVLRIPLTVVVSGTDYYAVRATRNQIRHNVKTILWDWLKSDLWWALRLPGKRGGGDLQERAWMSATGQQAQGVVEAFAVIPLAIHYKFVKTVGVA